MSDWKKIHPQSFYSDGNLHTLPDHALRMIARSDAGEPPSIAEEAKHILRRHRPIFGPSINSTPDDALSPYECAIYREKGIPIAFKNGWWRRSDESPVETPKEFSSAPERTSSARAECLSLRFANHSSEILAELAKSRDAATRTAAICILDKRSRHPGTP